MCHLFIKPLPCLIALALPTAPASVALAAQSTTATFTGGQTNGWSGSGNDPGNLNGNGVGTYVDVDDGTPAPSLRTQFLDFFLTYSNTSADWTGDYTVAPFTFSVDVNSRDVRVLSTPTTAPMVLQFRDYDDPYLGFPYTAVSYNLGTISSEGVNGQVDWQTLSVTVDDPTQAELPPGWVGYGDEDPTTFEPILPPGRTFANVLTGVDEVVLMTIEPGFFSTFVTYDVAIDNPTLSFTAVPEPTTAAALGFGVGLLLRRRR